MLTGKYNHRGFLFCLFFQKFHTSCWDLQNQKSPYFCIVDFHKRFTVVFRGISPSVSHISTKSFGSLCLKVARFPLSQTLTDPHMEHMMEPGPLCHRRGLLRGHLPLSLSVCRSNLLCLRLNQLKALPYLPAFFCLPSIRDSTCVGESCTTDSSKSHLKLLDNHIDMMLFKDFASVNILE